MTWYELQMRIRTSPDSYEWSENYLANSPDPCFKMLQTVNPEFRKNFRVVKVTHEEEVLDDPV